MRPLIVLCCSYVFFVGPRSYLNDVLILDLTTARWRTIEAPKVSDDAADDDVNVLWPQSRHNHAGVAIGDSSILVFGGSGEHGFLDDLWMLRVNDDGSDVAWRRVPKSDPWPAARHGHAWCSVVRDGRQFVVLQGGHSGRQSQGATYHGDLWVFDVATERFHQVESSSAPQVRAMRSWHNVVALGELFLLVAFGYTFRGGGEVYFGDVWLVELELAGGVWRTHWRSVEVTGDVGAMVARNRVAMCALDDGVSVFAYGGNEFDGRRDEFFDLPTVLKIDGDANRAHATLLRPRVPDSASVKLGHAVAVRLPSSGGAAVVVVVCGGERSRVRLDSMLYIELNV